MSRQNTKESVDEGLLAEVGAVEVKLMRVQTRKRKRAKLNRTILGVFGVFLFMDFLLLISVFLRGPGGDFTGMALLTLFFCLLFVMWATFFFMNRGRDRIQQQRLIREKNKVLNKMQLSGAVMIVSQTSELAGKLTLQEDMNGRLSSVVREGLERA